MEQKYRRVEKEERGKTVSLPINEIVCGDCLEVMQGFPDESVDLAMFSPPYWGLRDYGMDGQIGLEEHPLKYVEKMVQVCGEVKRVLKKTGSMYVVIGDTYFGGGAHSGTKSMGKLATPKVIKEFESTRKMMGFGQKNWVGIKDNGWLQPKQLLGIPWRVAIVLQEEGWILRNDVIWAKPNHMPSSVTDRLTNAYEHIFHFVKSRKYYYDLNAIREPHKEGVTRWGGDVMKVPKNLKEQQGLSKVLGNEERPWRNPEGKNPGDVLKTENAQDAFFGHPPTNYYRMGESELGKNPSDFWNITTKPFKGAHFAVYPEQLCIRPIKSSCPPDGTVLDPFAGSGTTLAVAKKLGRKYVGIDLNPKYVELAKKRLTTIPEKLDTFLSPGSSSEESGLEVS